MTKARKFSFNEFLSANVGKGVSALDYVRSIYKALDLPADFVSCFSRLYRPEIRLEENHVFVADLFDRDRFEELSQGGTRVALAQYWLNLLEITGLFDDLDEMQAFALARGVAASWNSVIQETCPGAVGRATAIRDETTGEVFVTVGQRP